MQQNSNVKQMEEGSVAKLLLKFSLPAIMGMVINATYGIIDAIFVTQKFGPKGLAAVAITIPIMMIMFSAGMMIGIGTNTLLSIRIGERKIDEAERLLGVSFSLFLFVTVIFMIFGFIFMDPLLMFFGANREILPMSREFFSVTLAGVLFTVVSFGINSFLRSEGKNHIAMVSLFISALSNIFLVWLFLFVFDMSIGGSALATVIAQAICSVWIAWYYLSGRTLLRWRWSYIKFDLKRAAEITRMGIAPCFMNLANSILMALTNYQFNSYGIDETHSATAIAIMRVIQSIFLIIFMVILGLSQGAQPIVGYNTGAKKYDRVARTLMISLISVLIFTSLASLMVENIPHLLIRPFLSGDESLQAPAFAEMTTRALRIFMMLLPGVGIIVITSNYFQATGRAMISLLMTLTRQVVVLIPLLIILPLYFGIDGIWYATPVSDGCALVLCLCLLIYEYRHLKYLKGTTIKQ